MVVSGGRAEGELGGRRGWFVIMGAVKSRLRRGIRMVSRWSKW
jgi:hypothetical protein